MTIPIEYRADLLLELRDQKLDETRSEFVERVKWSGISRRRADMWSEEILRRMEEGTKGCTDDYVKDLCDGKIILPGDTLYNRFKDGYAKKPQKKQKPTLSENGKEYTIPTSGEPIVLNVGGIKILVLALTLISIVWGVNWGGYLAFLLWGTNRGGGGGGIDIYLFILRLGASGMQLLFTALALSGAMLLFRIPRFLSKLGCGATLFLVPANIFLTMLLYFVWAEFNCMLNQVRNGYPVTICMFNERTIVTWVVITLVLYLLLYLASRYSNSQQTAKLDS